MYRHSSFACAALLVGGTAVATPAPLPPQQGGGITGLSQTSRFSSEFNPAISFVVDVVGDHVQYSGRSDDGFNLELRAFEFTAASWIDPSAWAYFTAATDGEELAVEEAALQYVGFDSNAQLRAGRFFVDFGRQMQQHAHELRTVERPLVLRAYLGGELGGDGLQWDDWRPVGDATLMRWSLGAFASLIPEEDEFFPDPERSVDERKDLGDLNFTARVTSLTDLSDNTTAQVGASARFLPDYGVEFAATGDMADGLSNIVWGLDASWRWTDDTGLKSWTTGAELLVADGDVGANNPTPGTVDVVDQSLVGYYAYLDHAWDRFESAGLQVSQAELADGSRSRASEIELYYTRGLSEFQRLRFGVGVADMEDGEDSVRFVVQYTGIVGPHGHGVNW